MRIIAIIQARMGSTRLPGKVLKRLEDRTVLAHVVMRLQAVEEITGIVIATTTLQKDDPIENLAQALGISCYRGSEQDVLSRYYEAALEQQADAVLRITSDCPIIDSEVIRELIALYKREACDYISNTLERSFPRGLDAELFSFASLERAHREAEEETQREHVTPYLYQHPELFHTVSYRSPTDYSQYRWTLDTTEDWELITRVYSYLYKPGVIFSWKETIKLMETHPELPLINAHIEQKKL